MESDKILSLIRAERWLARKAGRTIEISRIFCGKPVTVQLILSSNNGIRVVFPSYLFNSSISFFTPTEPETRFCRNKQLLKSLIRALKKSALWKYVENKDFIQINRFNKIASKTKVRKEFDSMMNPRLKIVE